MSSPKLKITSHQLLQPKAALIMIQKYVNFVKHKIERRYLSSINLQATSLTDTNFDHSPRQSKKLMFSLEIKIEIPK